MVVGFEPTQPEGNRFTVCCNSNFAALLFILLMCFVRDLCHIIQRDHHGSSRLSIEFTRDSIGKEYLYKCLSHTLYISRLLLLFPVILCHMKVKKLLLRFLKFLLQ